MSPVVIKTGPQSPPTQVYNASGSSKPSKNWTDNEDYFSVAQAFQDWFQLLVSPRAFCEEQEGAGGMLSPLALTLAYSLLFGVFYLIMLCAWGSRMGMYGIIALFLVVIVVPATWLGYVVFCLLWGGLLHLTSLVFGGTGVYSGSYRAAVYSFAPSVLLLMLAGLLSLVFLPNWTGRASGPNTLVTLADYIGLAWGVILLGMSLRATQKLSIGAAIGTTIVSCGLLAGLFTLTGNVLHLLRSAS